jgi:hypothetical protein
VRIARGALQEAGLAVGCAEWRDRWNSLLMLLDVRVRATYLDRAEADQTRARALGYVAVGTRHTYHISRPPNRS